MRTILRCFLILFAVVIFSQPIYAFEIKDALGRKISFSTYPERIISLCPSITESLCSLGLEKKIVGVSNYCNFPPEIKKKPKIGDIILNYEKIVSLKPDIIILDATVCQSSILPLERLKIKVMAVKIDTLSDFSESLKLIGKATNNTIKADREIEAFNKSCLAAQKRVQKIPNSKRKKVFVEIWDKPLMTVGEGSFMNEIIDISGGKNVFSCIKKTVSAVNMEEVIKLNPDVIFLTVSKPADIYKNKVWKTINAVKSMTVYSINPDLFVRPTLRLKEGLLQIQTRLYPQLF